MVSLNQNVTLCASALPSRASVMVTTIVRCAMDFMWLVDRSRHESQRSDEVHQAGLYG